MAKNLEKPLLLSLWDRMEGAWLWTQMRHKSTSACAAGSCRKPQVGAAQASVGQTPTGQLMHAAVEQTRTGSAQTSL
jgi:hypothetical protein